MPSADLSLIHRLFFQDTGELKYPCMSAHHLFKSRAIQVSEQNSEWPGPHEQRFRMQICTSVPSTFPEISLAE